MFRLNGSKRRFYASALVVLGLAAGTVVSTATPAAAVGTCVITPALRDVTINQGVGSYAKLTRGKDTLVRAYLSLPQTMPSCAANGAFTQVTGGSLTVTGGTATTVTPTPAPVSPYAQVAAYAAAPSADGTADLKFVVPGTAFDSTNTAPYTASFSITISYQSAPTKQTSGLSAVTQVTFTTKTGSTTPITAAVGPPSNNLRVLVVPIGNKSDTSGAQFPATASTSVQNGMATVSRVMPVRRGIGDLRTPGNGIRYTLLPTGSMINASDLMPAGKLCIEPVNTWPVLSSRLATALGDWNAMNPSTPADRAIGVVWQDVSAGAEANCYEGISDVNGRQAMTRVYSDAQSTSRTGSLIAHEVLHTFGGAHSLNLKADVDAPNRAYNVTSRQFLLDNRSEMNTSFDATYTNNTTLFESAAYALAQCALTPGATGCTAPGTVGVAGAGGPALVLTGKTCGTSAACTNVLSYLDGDFQPRTVPDLTSPFTLVQLNGTAVVSTTPVPVPCVQEDDSEGGGPATTNPVCNVSLAVTFEAGANRLELRKGSTVLYSAANDGIAPSFTSALRTVSGTTLANWTAAAGDDTQPALCSNGSLVAWVDSSGIRVRRVDKSAPASAAGALPGAEPSWSPDCSRLVYVTSNGNVRTASVTVGAGAPTLTPRAVLYTSSLLGLLGNAPANHPAFTADGRSIVVGINRDIYRIDPGSFITPNPITCTIPLLNLLSLGCVPIVTTGAVEKNPAVSATGEVAYDSGADVRIANVDGSNQRAFISNATLPSFGGPIVTANGRPAQTALFVRGGTVWAHDPDGVDTQLTNGVDTRPALDGSGNTFAVDRTTSGQHDIWIGTITRSGIRATVTDNNIANVTLAVFVDCGGTLVPVEDPILPSAIQPGPGTSGTATFIVNIDSNAVCAGGTIVLRASDGWLTSTVQDGTVGSQHDPVPNIYTLTEGQHVKQFDSWAFTGGGTDADQPAGLALSWLITGPGGYSNSSLSGTDPADVQPPDGGFTPGDYTVRLCVTDSTGRTACTVHHFTVDPDSDHDGIVDALDRPCYDSETSVANDPSNADLDDDGDGLANRDDPEPCTPPNVHVDVNPDSFYVFDYGGDDIVLHIVDLYEYNCDGGCEGYEGYDFSTVDPATVRLTAIDGLPFNLAVKSWDLDESGHGLATFDRGALNDFLRANGLYFGYVQFAVTGTNGDGLRFLGSGEAYPFGNEST